MYGVTWVEVGVVGGFLGYEKLSHESVCIISCIVVISDSEVCTIRYETHNSYMPCNTSDRGLYTCKPLVNRSLGRSLVSGLIWEPVITF